MALLGARARNASRRRPAPRATASATQALASLRQLGGELHFYGKLAAEDLGQPVRACRRGRCRSPPTSARRRASTPALTRALQLIELGLRSEGVREWNYSLRGMTDRRLLAAADLACEREVWDRCINTSDRTRNEIDLAQRLPDAVPRRGGGAGPRASASIRPTSTD